MTGWNTKAERHIPEEELHAYLDQALSRSQCAEIETHLSSCRACQAARGNAAALRDRTTALLSGLTPRPVIIDTDMAGDDWLAILYLLNRPDVSVQAITVTGTGEAHCGPGIKHALSLTALAGQPDIPVSCGRETPLQGDHAGLWDGCCLLERQTYRFTRPSFSTSRDILGKTAPAIRRDIPEYIIARLELLDVFTNRFNPSRNVRSENLVFGF